MNEMNEAAVRFGWLRCAKAARLVRWGAAIALSTAVLAGCGSMRQTAAPTLAASDAVAIGPIANFTETPAAGGSAGRCRDELAHRCIEARPRPWRQGLTPLLRLPSIDLTD